MISNCFYKDRPGIKVCGDGIEAVFLPEDGGKLVSLKISGKEMLAQREGEKYLRLGPDTSYVKSECSAFDDMFPTIDPCVIGDFTYSDHGEVSRTAFDYTIADDVVHLKCDAKSVNAVFSKSAYCVGDTLNIAYKIENKNDFRLPYIWAGHIMLVGEEGAEIISGYESDAAVTVAFGNPPDMEYANILQKCGENKEYKYYYDYPQVPMECFVAYPKMCKKIEFSFEGDAVKYLGIWMNPGDLNGMYNLAIEPCTAPYDNPEKAEEKGKGSYIDPYGSVEFVLKIRGVDLK